MKKVISALTLGALIFGTAYADVKLNANYRNGTYIVNHVNDGDHDTTRAKADKTSTTWLDQTAYNGGKDTVKLSLSSDVVDVVAQLQPTVDSDAICFNQLSGTLKFGGLQLESGWYKDGFDKSGIRITTANGDWEGGHAETFKPGNIMKSTLGYFICDLSNIAQIDDYVPIAAARYTLGNDSLSLMAQGNVIFDRSMKKSTANKSGDTPYDVYNGAYGWGGLVKFTLKNAFSVVALGKGNQKMWGDHASRAAFTGSKTANWGYGSAYGLYFQPEFSKNFKGTFGGEMAWFDGHLADFSFDARFSIKSGNLTIQSLNNYSYAIWSDGTEYVDYHEKNVHKAESCAEIAVSSNLKSKYTLNGRDALWNGLIVDYKVNDTFNAQLHAGAITVLHANRKYYNPGSQINVMPAVVITATKGAAISVGVSNTWTGVGGENDKAKRHGITLFGEDPNYELTVPVLFRVKM